MNTDKGRTFTLALNWGTTLYIALLAVLSAKHGRDIEFTVALFLMTILSAYISSDITRRVKISKPEHPITDSQ